DMTLGQWFRGLDVEVVHEEGFHQAEPFNYHEDLLRASGTPVSFHRFGARLPASAKAEEVAAVRQKNWRSWVETYFSPPGNETARPRPKEAGEL
ncbi:unnamed protein product, partial [Polarella glacialis]